MNLTLTRKEFRKDGIFGELTDDHGDFFLFTLEHAFQITSNPDGWAPKLAAGVYKCLLSQHALHDGVKFFTYQIMDVPPFMDHPVTGILFHHGNYNKDSDGCVLLGLGQGREQSGGKMLTSSDKACAHLMKTQVGLTEFTLTVVDPSAKSES